MDPEVEYVSADVCQAQLELLAAANKQVKAAEDQAAEANRARFFAESRARGLEAELQEAHALLEAIGLGRCDGRGWLSVDEAHTLHRRSENELERLRASNENLEREVDLLRRENEMRRGALVHSRHTDPALLEALDSHFRQTPPRSREGGRVLLPLPLPSPAAPSAENFASSAPARSAQAPTEQAQRARAGAGKPRGNSPDSLTSPRPQAEPAHASAERPPSSGGGSSGDGGGGASPRSLRGSSPSRSLALEQERAASERAADGSAVGGSPEPFPLAPPSAVPQPLAPSPPWQPAPRSHLRTASGVGSIQLASPPLSPEWERDTPGSPGMRAVSGGFAATFSCATLGMGEQEEGASRAVASARPDIGCGVALLGNGSAAAAGQRVAGRRRGALC